MNRNRRSIRLRGYDYSQAGVYFVTICTHNRRSEKSFAPYLFGEIVDGEMVLNDVGRLVAKCWRDIPAHFPHVELDEFIVMPNHVHGILLIANCRGTACRAPTGERFGKPIGGSLPTIVRSFKSAATKRINERRNEPGMKFWQRNYYEHIIRNEGELSDIREYIVNNPLKWEFDRENPNIIVGARHVVLLPPGSDWETAT